MVVIVRNQMMPIYSSLKLDSNKMEAIVNALIAIYTNVSQIMGSAILC